MCIYAHILEKACTALTTALRRLNQPVIVGNHANEVTERDLTVKCLHMDLAW